MTLAMRKWATPLTAATFIITGVTGIVLFFHSGGILSRVAHEWIGMAIMVVFLFHIAINWRPFLAYFKKPVGATIMVLGVVLTAATFVPLDQAQSGGGMNPGRLIGALQKAPITALATMTDKTADTIVTDLQAAGFANATTETTVADLTQGDRGQIMAVLGIALN
ncbi:DUF4405 domain-containing protein [Pseudoprimorskyibacter insulae]|uniref:Uncharacterized protein n=1 Tax=Pseudoprimorskyibacter insulae TaxID=1695997 RepID=A0A2R8APU2_9RHOB|nr:DUF4405 domain-containing protein [Pseudoprimorskyibacter insulae]SPF77917.1 hypothetical protein PRI8871_00504 [Pseudoprimorskyibacter insulae]